MCKQLWPFVIRCDTPPYAVVLACKGSGFQSPLDVGWCHMSQVKTRTTQHRSSFGSRLWQFLFGASKPKETICVCGQPLPELKQYHLAVHSEKESDYLLGQCCRCRTIFWDEAVPLPAWMDNGMLG